MPSTSSDLNIVEITIAEIREGLEKRLFTAEQLLEVFLARIDRYEPFYNAFTFMNPGARDEARRIDELRAAGVALGPLAGVPVVVKESMDMIGFPSTAGWSELSPAHGGLTLMPVLDAPVVARLKAAGAIIVGKTNIPALSLDGARTRMSWDGPTYNAADRRFAPGGSSTGTATAVSANFAVVGLAEETTGSIQNPSAAQSLVGIKPTFGLVPNIGVAPLATSTRDVVGPHARTVTDAAILLDVLAGYCIEDPKTMASIGMMPEGGYTSMLKPGSLRGARIGIYGPGWREQPLSADVEEQYAAVKAELVERGAILIEDPFAGTDFNRLGIPVAWKDDSGVEAIAYDLDQFIRRFGSGSPVSNLRELLAAVKVDPFSEDGPASILNHIPNIEQSLRDPETAPDMSSYTRSKQAYLRTFNAVMATHSLDALIYPQCRDEPPRIEGDAALNTTTNSEINIAGLPGITVPAGRFRSGAPFSIIIVGKPWSEAELLSLAYDYEQTTKHRIVSTLEETPYGS